MKTVLAMGILAAAGVAAAAPQTVQKYSYDGNGRLVTATTTVSGVGTQTTYTLDDADNRSARTTVSGSFAAREANPEITLERPAPVERAEAPAAPAAETGPQAQIQARAEQAETPSPAPASAPALAAPRAPSQAPAR